MRGATARISISDKRRIHAGNSAINAALLKEVYGFSTSEAADTLDATAVQLKN